MKKQAQEFVGRNVGIIRQTCRKTERQVLLLKFVWHLKNAKLNENVPTIFLSYSNLKETAYQSLDKDPHMPCIRTSGRSVSIEYIQLIDMYRRVYNQKGS
jgi:replicative DNA helicase